MIMAFLHPSQLTMKKTVGSTYLLYLLGGFFSGAHRHYLQMGNSAVWYSWTLGYFGFGIVEDAFLIPLYVRDHNMSCHCKAVVDNLLFRYTVLIVFKLH